MRIVLASQSPRRAELLGAAAIEFDVDPADIDESTRAGELPEAYVLRVAREKAAVVAARHPGRVVLAADTVVAHDATLFGKPADRDDAARMLRALSGRAHDVHTAVVLARDEQRADGIESTRVEVAKLSEEEIAWYLASGEADDKAGAYGIQGRFSRFIPRIEGSYTNVVGLPVELVYRLLAKFAEAPATR